MSKRFEKVMVIYNSAAGQNSVLAPFLNVLFGLKQASADLWTPHQSYADKIIECLDKHNIQADLTYTRHAGHATEIAQKCVTEKYDLVVAVGGDGTLNEVANALAESDVVMGIVPMGTANIFALQMNIPVDIEQACRRIANGEIHHIDLGKGAGRYFMCMAGVGFDAYILKKTEREHKKLLGALAYVLVAIAKIMRYKFRRIVIRVDDEERSRKGYFVMIAKCKYYGGNKIIADLADPEDGFLDVCIFKKRNMTNLFLYLAGIRKRDILKFTKIEHVKCKRVMILKNGRHPIHVDAEYLGKSPIEFVVCPQALKVVY